MIGPNAGWSIARVTDISSVGDRTTMKLIREAMYQDLRRSRGDTELAIATIAGSAFPEPAGFSFFDLSPEADGRRSVTSRSGLMGLVPDMCALSGFLTVGRRICSVCGSQSFSMLLSICTIVGALFPTAGLVVPTEIGLPIFGIIPRNSHWNQSIASKRGGQCA